MTKLMTFLTTVLFTLICNSQSPFSGFNTDEDFKGTIWVDPTFTDAGAHFGLGIRKELEWGWVGVEASVYPELSVSYWDAIGQGGIIYNITSKFDVLGGFRLGYIDRNGNPFPLAGAIMIFEYEIFKDVSISVRLWVDHREDQRDQFFGDSDGYTPGIIFTSPLSQENGAAGITFRF